MSICEINTKNMTVNLTDSAIDRQNILNNPDFLDNIQKFLGITGMLYDGEYRFTTAQIADFYEVNIKTIRRYIEASEKELTHNGYCVLKGKKLKEFKDAFGHLIYADIEEEEMGGFLPIAEVENDEDPLMESYFIEENDILKEDELPEISDEELEEL